MAMQIIINETNERKSLSLIDHSSGVDLVQDLIGNSGAIGQYIAYDSDADAYRMSQADYDWWADYISKADADADELAELRDEYDTDEVQAILDDEFRGINDYDDHHGAYQAAFARIRDELTKR